jgi:glutathione S-transferase
MDEEVAETYRLYDLLDSPFCLKARICLSLKGVPYERVPLTVSRLSELRRLNPLGKVPVLVDQERPTDDSSRIARLLEERFPRPPLLPKDASARAYCHVLEEWADESLYFLVGAFKWLNPANRGRSAMVTAEMASGLFPAWLVTRLVRRRVVRRYRANGYAPDSLPQLEERMVENLSNLADLLAGNPFLLGKYATLADIAVFSQLHWMSGYDERRLLEAAPAVLDWMARFEDLDEVRQAVLGESPAPEIEELLDEIEPLSEATKG